MSPEERWADVALATTLFAIDPPATGGLLVRAASGPQRDRLTTWVRELFDEHGPLLRMPAHITDDRLLGGLSLAETLRTRRVVNDAGLLTRAHGGALVLPSAERLEARTVATLSAALDRHAVSVEREGITDVVACRLGVVALDEGIGEEAVASALQDRLAFRVELDGLPLRDASAPDLGGAREARARLATTDVDDAIAHALCEAAWALGIESLRAPLLALQAARAHAALEGRSAVGELDARVAARLVLGPRATRLPSQESSSERAAPESPPPDRAPEQPESAGEPTAPLGEILVEAAESGVDPALLEALKAGRVRRARAKSGKAGSWYAGTAGRPAGTGAASWRPDERLNVVETLRAAAPWQRVRRAEAAVRADRADRVDRVEVRKADFRVTRRRDRAETTVIFVVDASGSSALQRLAEAKGAVERVLADCYVRRDQVALIAFRGERASLLLPPTRSLTRARRCLSRLAGGGTTPLASALDAASALATETRKRGGTPLLVLMTDGRANVARDGRVDGASAAADASASARALREGEVPSLMLDIAPRPRERARRLATDMGAQYVPLPYFDAALVSSRVRALATETDDGRAARR